ncbi:SemiSWEET transporter [Paractinoplanes globisporus]|uniref:SemiSWEET transporter n=1 Tax=Paractinoplanes globisporus TaxID=113565 RepID=A0ABW6WII2_9ACTN|nr:SemiSWEET transporter [Actinoplanes globisporus]
MLTHTLGAVGAALSMSLSWPQVYKSCIQRRTTGLSATASALGAAMPLGWITYGTLSGQRIQIVTNVVTGAAGLAILVALLATQPALRNPRALRLSATAFGAVLTTVALSGLAAALPGVRAGQVAPMLGLALAAVSVLSNIPQPLALLRDRTQDLSGLSPLRWRMGAGACASWLVYGLGTAQPAVWASAAAGLTAAVIVCAVLHLRREPTPEFATPRWRDGITTRTLAMTGI